VGNDPVLIRVKDLFHVYGEGTERKVTAVAGVNLTIRKGEFVSIIGPNGSGKSTLARHLNGLTLPTGGDVIVNGMNTKSEHDVWAIRQTVGMVFQNPDNQLVATTVEEDVAFGPENLGLPRDLIEERVRGALRSVGMEEHSSRAPHLLSGGQKQRVAIAGVLAMQPACVVLDEATAMLDPAGKREVMDTITRLNRDEGVTIIHITHFMEEAVEANRVLVMYEGRIVMDDSPVRVFKNGEALRSYQLDVPEIVELRNELGRAGVCIPDDVLTVDEMVDFVCR